MRWIATLMVALVGLNASAAGQGSPPGCNGASGGATFKIFVDDAPNPQTDCVQNDQDISYQITLETGPPIDVDGDGTVDFFSCNNLGGTLTLTLPSGDQIVLDGEADLPEWGYASEAIHVSIGAYTANADDVDENGFLTAHLFYENWTTLSDPPIVTEKTMEFTISVCMITQNFCCDTNGDGFVDIEDLTSVIMNWGTDDPDADVDGNGVVDIVDIKCIILSWGPC